MSDHDALGRPPFSEADLALYDALGWTNARRNAEAANEEWAKGWATPPSAFLKESPGAQKQRPNR